MISLPLKAQAALALLGGVYTALLISFIFKLYPAKHNGITKSIALQSKKGPPQRVKDLLILEIAYAVYFEIETIVQSLLSPFILNFSLSPAFAPYISRIAGAVTDIMFLSGSLSHGPRTV